MSSAPFLVVANFKSHQTQSDLTSWLNRVKVPSSPSISLAIAPSFPHLSLLSDVRYSNSDIRSCAQTVSPFPPGSYTGAVNAHQLQEMGINYCLVGHSERRIYFHEDSNDVARQVHELVSVGITPIICQRAQDIAPDRAALNDGDLVSAIFCFEPSADIGGTVTAPLEEIKKVTTQISSIFATPKVMYGGSVNANNITPLLTLDLAGVLVSTASLNPTDFNSLLSLIPHE